MRDELRAELGPVLPRPVRALALGLVFALILDLGVPSSLDRHGDRATPTVKASRIARSAEKQLLLTPNTLSRLKQHG
jgi:hypothetical protein